MAPSTQSTHGVFCFVPFRSVVFCFIYVFVGATAAVRFAHRSEILTVWPNNSSKRTSGCACTIARACRGRVGAGGVTLVAWFDSLEAATTEAGIRILVVVFDINTVRVFGISYSSIHVSCIHTSVTDSLLVWRPCKGEGRIL